MEIRAGPARDRVAVHPGIRRLAGGEAATFEHLTFETDQPYAVIVASSVGSAPIATTKRLLVTAIARVQPTGFRWVDESKFDVAEPGRPLDPGADSCQGLLASQGEHQGVPT